MTLDNLPMRVGKKRNAVFILELPIKKPIFKIGFFIGHSRMKAAFRLFPTRIGRLSNVIMSHE